MPAGRPTKYKKEMCNMVVPFMAQGYSQKALAGHLGISEDSLYEWIKQHPEFSESVKDGSTQSAIWWEKVGMSGMVGKIAGFNATTWIFNMKNRHGWTDKIETTGSVEVKFSGLSPEERERKIKEFENKRDQSLRD